MSWNKTERINLKQNEPYEFNVQLPSEFKGKKFMIMPMLSEVSPNISPSILVDFGIYVKDEDYEKATFRVWIGSLAWALDYDTNIDAWLLKPSGAISNVSVTYSIYVIA